MSDISAIPERSFTASSNLGIIFTQFNELNFYVEDKNKENFYLNLLKKLFPLIEITRIFGLGGKPNVTRAAARTLDSKKDIYIVDLDFDEILDKKETHPNLFYLRRYSIENYLVEDVSIKEFIKEERTTLRDEEIQRLFNIEQFIEHSRDILIELAACFFIINKYGVRKEYYQLNINRDINMTQLPFQYRMNFIPDYIKEVKASLAIKKPKVSFDNQLRQAKKHFKSENFLVNIPGKYLLTLIKHAVIGKFGLTSETTNESFNFRIGKNCELRSLHYLRDDINNFVA